MVAADDGCRRIAGPRSAAVFAKPAGLITRTIPGTNEQLPIVGLGSSATFAQVARSDDVDALRAVLKQMVDLGGTVFDTAPSYGASEEVAGRMAQELGIAKQAFLGDQAERRAARRRVCGSQSGARTARNVLQAHRQAGDRSRAGPQPGRPPHPAPASCASTRRRAASATSASPPPSSPSTPTWCRSCATNRIDFIGIDYAVDNRHAEETILPLARDKGIGVLVYMPFGRTRLWQRVKGREVPDWAREFDANSWAQFFLKYVASHPAVTAITPATSQPRTWWTTWAAPWAGCRMRP